MAKSEDILVNNLTGSLKSAQRYIAIGIGTSALAATVIIREAYEPGTSLQETGVPLFSFSAPAGVAALFALITYFSSGLLSVFALNRAREIALELDGKSPEILRAALRFPSVLTVSPSLLRSVIALVPVVVLWMSLIPLFAGIVYPDESAVLFVAVLGVPYIILALLLLQPLERPRRNGRS